MQWDVFLDAYQELKRENDILREKVKELTNGGSIGNSESGIEIRIGGEEGLREVRQPDTSSQSDDQETSE